MKVDDLISDMREVKAEHPILEISDVLRIFNIQAMKDLTAQITRSINGR